MTNVTFARRLQEPPGPRKSMTQHVMEPRSFRWWYDSLIDWMIAHPGGSMEDAAKDLGRSAVWLRIVANSDSFQAQYQARRGQLSDAVNQRLANKLTKAAELSLDCIIDRLEQKQDKVPLPTLLDLQEKSLNRLGYGTNSAVPMAQQVVQNQQNNYFTVDKDTLVAARERIRVAEEMRLQPAARDAAPYEPARHEPASRAGEGAGRSLASSTTSPCEAGVIVDGSVAGLPELGQVDSVSASEQGQQSVPALDDGEPQPSQPGAPRTDSLI
jgi:hypothetical protein